MISRAFVLTTVSLLTLSLSSQAVPPKPTNIRFELGQKAKELATFFTDDLKKTSVRIRDFESLGEFESSAGVGLAQQLGEELKKNGIQVNQAKAQILIQGEFEPVKDSESGHVGALLTLTLRDLQTRKKLDKKQFQIGILGNANFQTLFGAPFNKDPDEQNQAADDSVTKPKAVVENKTIVRSHKGGVYALEILVKENGVYKPRKARIDQGHPFVTINREEVYAVRVINDTNHEAAIELKVDGLSMFAFSKIRHTTGFKKGNPKFRFILVRPHSSFLIKGWHVDNKETDEFKVTEYAKPGVAKLGIQSRAKVGAITVTFGAAWPKDQDPPSDEPKKGTPRSADNATGFGKRIKQVFKVVPRTLGVLRDTITIRYNK